MTERQEEEILRESDSPIAPPPLSRVPGTLCLCDTSFRWASHCPSPGFLRISSPSVPLAPMSLISRSPVCSYSSFNSFEMTFLYYVSSIELSGLGSFPE